MWAAGKISKCKVKIVMNTGLGKTSYKRHLGDKWRKLIMNWVLNGIKELLIILGLLMVLWLYRSMCLGARCRRRI